MGILFDSQDRRALLKDTFEQVAVLIAMSILLDALAQFLILHEVSRSAAVIIGPVLIALPYSLVRAVTNQSWATQAESIAQSRD
jgi:accessory gene regulator protein AgrB